VHQDRPAGRVGRQGKDLPQLAFGEAPRPDRQLDMADAVPPAERRFLHLPASPRLILAQVDDGADAVAAGQGCPLISPRLGAAVQRAGDDDAEVMHGPFMEPTRHPGRRHDSQRAGDHQRAVRLGLPPKCPPARCHLAPILPEGT